jgi:outer membrane protein TolC
VLGIKRQAPIAVLNLEAAYRSLALARKIREGYVRQVLVANDQLGVGTITPFVYQQVMDNAAAAERDVLTQQLNVLSRRIELDLLLGNTPGT